MTINEVIENVKRLKEGCDIDEKQLISDINRVEMYVLYNVVSGREGDNEIVTSFGNYNLHTDRDTELFVPAPFDRIYEEFCCGKVDLEYGDDERYANDSTAYNNTLTEFKLFWWKRHRQKKRYQFHL